MEKKRNLIQNVHPVSFSWTRNMFQDHTTLFKLPQNQIGICWGKSGKKGPNKSSKYKHLINIQGNNYKIAFKSLSLP